MDEVIVTHRISASLEAAKRASRAIQPVMRMKIRYSKRRVTNPRSCPLRDFPARESAGQPLRPTFGTAQDRGMPPRASGPHPRLEPAPSAAHPARVRDPAQPASASPLPVRRRAAEAAARTGRSRPVPRPKTHSRRWPDQRISHGRITWKRFSARTVEARTVEKRVQQHRTPHTGWPGTPRRAARRAPVPVPQSPQARVRRRRASHRRPPGRPGRSRRRQRAPARLRADGQADLAGLRRLGAGRAAGLRAG